MVWPSDFSDAATSVLMAWAAGCLRLSMLSTRVSRVHRALSSGSSSQSQSAHAHPDGWGVPVPLACTSSTHHGADQGGCARQTLGAVTRLSTLPEYFNMMGWFPGRLSPSILKMKDRLDVDLNASLVGNACSDYNLGPVVLSFCGVAGIGRNPKPVDIVEQSDESDTLTW